MKLCYVLVYTLLHWEGFWFDSCLNHPSYITLTFFCNVQENNEIACYEETITFTLYSSGF